MLVMKFVSLVFAAFVCASQAHDSHRHHHGELAFPTGDDRDLQAAHAPRCGAKHLSPEESKAAQHMFRIWKRNQPKDRMLSNFDPINVQVYFHVIAETEGGLGSEAINFVHDQLQILNDRFLPYGFTFSLAVEPEITVNRAWYQGRKEEEMKTALKQGGPETLNVYTNGGNGYLGFAYFPTIIGTEYEVLDGVVIYYQSMPGGNLEPPETKYIYNQGLTLVHEVGHWLLLLHTFHGENCDCLGDFVDDTPIESEYTSGCPIGKDTCLSDSGLDPIHNYMDYSEDTCTNHFTPGQAERMLFAWETYRDPNATAISDVLQVYEGPPSSPCGEDSSGQDFFLQVTTDSYGDETFWTVVNVDSNEEVLSGGPFASHESYNLGPYCLGAGTYEFNIYDLFGDGMCCQFGKGSYEAFVDSTRVARGGRFECGESTLFGIVA